MSFTHSVPRGERERRTEEKGHQYRLERQGWTRDVVPGLERVSWGEVVRDGCSDTG